MQWHGKAPVEFVYEDLRADPETYLMELGQHLGLECSPGGILDQLGRPPKRKPWSLPMRLMRAIEGQGREWLDRFGYPPLEEINNPCEPYSK
jgi:LPS sulfotransferase NodH